MKNAGYWNLTGSNIIIDDLDPTKNWSYTESHYDWCSGSGTWNDPYIIENVTIDSQNSGSCIYITNSYVPFIIKNCTLSNSGSGSFDAGIRLETVENGKLISNNCSNNNYYGIYLYKNSNNNTIINNTASFNKREGIMIHNECNNNTILQNSVIYNEGSGIRLYYKVDNNKIINNNIYYNYAHGINLYVAKYNLLLNNTIDNNGHKDGDFHGIYLTEICNFNTIENCTIKFNDWAGIKIYSSSYQCYHNYIKNNTICYNTYQGIWLHSNTLNNGKTYNNFISYNYIYQNQNGIQYFASWNNIIYKNTIMDNFWGIFVWKLASIANLHYKNEFIGNTKHVDDTIGSNIWDNGSIGNYWDDYIGFDSNDDGIGDSPYIRGYVKDNFPIWNDGDDIPIINASKPINGTFFGAIAPNYNVSINAADLNTSWYSLNDGINYTFTSLSGIINQSAWDACDNGTVKIEFYVNDTAGNLGYDEVYVYKDIFFPNITIISPKKNQLFSHDTIDFEILIDEPNLNLTWYTLNGGLNYVFNETTGMINSEAWESCENGSVIIRFYANDSAGNNGFGEVIVRKDIEKPNISITSPTPFQLFGNNTFNFELTIDEGNLNVTWYTLDNGLNNYTFLGTSGIINQDAWKACDNGTVTLRFYANDSVGNVAFKEIFVRKDKINPVINIIKPEPYNIFGNSTFSYEIHIEEANLQSIWYSFNNGINNYFINQFIGIIEQEAWDQLGNGTIILTFYANDSIGNEGSSKVIIRKNIYAPVITFDFSETYLNTTTPEYYHKGLEVSCEILNFTSLLWVYICENSSGLVENRSMAYLGNGWWTYTIDITALEWSDQFSFHFITKDELGYTSIKNNFTNMYTIRIYDFKAPIITINSPSPNELFGIQAPTFSIDIIEVNLLDKWYSFDGGDNITFTIETQFDQTEWDKIGSETFLLTFYAIDLAGNLNSSEIIIRKDAYIPNIIIIYPVSDEIFGNIAPEFNITIIEENLYSTWYTVEGITLIFSLSELNGIIDQDVWNDLPQGEIVITFYAQDRAGNIGTISITVIKSIPSQSAIPGYNLFFLLGIISIVSILVSKKIKKS